MPCMQTSGLQRGIDRLCENHLFSWLLTDNSVERQNIQTLMGQYNTVDYEHLLVSFEELLSPRLSDPFAWVVG